MVQRLKALPGDVTVARIISRARLGEELSLGSPRVTNRAERHVRHELRARVETMRESGLPIHYSFTRADGPKIRFPLAESPRGYDALDMLGKQKFGFDARGLHRQQRTSGSNVVLAVASAIRPTRSDLIAAQVDLAGTYDGFTIDKPDIVGSYNRLVGLSLGKFLQLFPISNSCTGSFDGSLSAHLMVHRESISGESQTDCHRVLKELRRVDLNRSGACALAILEWLHLNRDKWCQRQLVVDGTTVGSASDWLFVPTSFLASRLFPTKRHTVNQHGPVGRALLGLLVGGELDESSDGLGVSPFLDGILDSLDLNRVSSPGTEELRMMLALLPETKRRGFCVRLSPVIQRSLLPHTIDAGKPVWGYEAVTASRRRASSASSPDSEERWVLAKRIEKQWKECRGYIEWDNNYLLLAQVCEWPTSALRLWLTILSNRRNSKKGSNDRPYVTLSDPSTGRRFLPISGAAVRPWRLSKWLDVAEYDRSPTKQNSCRKFVDDLLMLNSVTGLEAQVDQMEWEESLKYLRSISSRPKQWTEIPVLPLLPANWRETIAEHLEAIGKAFEVPWRRWNSGRLRRLLAVSGLSQRELAQRLQVSEALISQWMHGRRPIAANHFGALSELEYRTRGKG